MILENKIPIKTYTWTHKDIEDLLSDLNAKEYLLDTFCVQNKWHYIKSIILNIKDKGCILRFDVYDNI